MISSTDGLQVPAHARKANVKARSVSFKKGTRSVSSQKGKRSWNGHYCCVPDCKNSSSNKKVQDDSGHVSYHVFPNVQSVKGKHWIKRIRRDQGNNFVVNSTTKIYYYLFIYHHSFQYQCYAFISVIIIYFSISAITLCCYHVALYIRIIKHLL